MTRILENIERTHHERCARIAHEANRLWCIMLGDDSQATWECAESWQKDSALKGVIAVLEGQTPSQLHESWMQQKIADGWVWGQNKDAIAKTHPCLLPYSKLSREQRAKDHIFQVAVKIAHAMNGPVKHSAAWDVLKSAVLTAMAADHYDAKELIEAALDSLHRESWRSHWFYLHSYAGDDESYGDVSLCQTARSAALALAKHDVSTGKPPRSVVEFQLAVAGLLSTKQYATMDASYIAQSKGMESLAAKMLPVVKNELYERGNAATCLPEDRHVTWSLMKGLLVIADFLKVPLAGIPSDCVKVVYPGQNGMKGDRT